MAETSPTQRTWRTRGEKPEASPHTETSMERRAGRKRADIAGTIPGLGERQVERAIETRRKEHIQFNRGEDPGVLEEAEIAP